MGYSQIGTKPLPVHVGYMYMIVVLFSNLLSSYNTDVLSKGVWQTVRELQDPELKRRAAYLPSGQC